MKSGIYKITNTVNGKFYIGSAVNIPKRRHTHLSALRKGTHHSAKLQFAWNKYGEDSFAFETLLLCAKENLVMYEQRCIDGFGAVRSGYNNAPIAGSSLGRVATPETRRKMAEARTGMRRSLETRQLLSAGKIGNKSRLGMRHSDETKRKMSEASKGRPKSPEHREALKGFKNTLGMVHSEETKKKMSLARKLYYQRKREATASQLLGQTSGSDSGTAPLQ